MFILHVSNKTENLLEHLAAVIDAAPLSSPFAQEIFLIQSQGMERWLSQQLASRFKVWGNAQFLFPHKFFSAIAQQVESELQDQPFERGRLLWQLEALLRQVGDDPVYAPLQHYLSGSNAAVKRYQLARQLAQLFDQYQIMRPDMLQQWQQGQSFYACEAENWQRELWRQLLDKLGDRHRGRIWLQVIQRLQSAAVGDFSASLPERVTVFGLSTLPPLFLALLQALAKHCDVHFYLLNPAQHYWADLQNKRQLAKQRLPAGSDTGLGHPLLAILGQQGREFQEMLLETELEYQLDSFEAPENVRQNNLQQLQYDILNNQPSGVVLQNDRTIQVHACHSRMREVQVLKNQLLHLLQTDPALQLRDMVVMAPDIQDYEPFISAVFADIQHAIADRSLRLSNVVLDVFIRFLRLSQSRFGWPEVLDLLEQPTVYPSVGLSETDLQLIRCWVRKLYVRWGKSAEHKASLGLPPLSANTWQAALDRLLMGYAVEDESDFVNETLPYADIEGASARALGGLHDFLQLLFQAGSDLSRAKPLLGWAEQLSHYSQRLFPSTVADPAELQPLHQLLSELGEAMAMIHEHDVELSVILNWLEDAVQERKSATGFLRGQLTFCSMLPMRSIPFKVIALLGLNEGEFPKIDSHPTFDLLGRHYRMGDRSRRADDRYQFLEIVLSARSHLIITYIGLSNRTNEALPPSVVISEMLEILRDSYQLHDLVTEHPLQPFSPRYFRGNAELFSYSETDCRTASALSAPLPDAMPWWRGRIDGESDPVIDIAALFAYYRNPQKYFFRQQLAVSLDGIETEPEAREPFVIDGLDAYQINRDWIDAELNGRSLSLEMLQAQGRWPAAVGGEILYRQHQQAIADFVARIEQKQLGDRLDELPIDLSIGSYRLLGKLANRYRNGSLFYRYAKLKGADFFMACLHHHIVNLIEPQSTWLLSDDTELLFAAEHADPQRLLALLDLYQQGQTNPHQFFVEPALVYLRQALRLKQGSRAKKPAIEAAADHLQAILDKGYDAELALACRDVQTVGELLGDDFELVCHTWLLPVWESIQIER